MLMQKVAVEWLRPLLCIQDVLVWKLASVTEVAFLSPAM